MGTGCDFEFVARHWRRPLRRKQHRSTYYELLNRVRQDGDWESWLLFFLEGVRLTAEGAVAATRLASPRSQSK
jgi:Fic family protein